MGATPYRIDATAASEVEELRAQNEALRKFLLDKERIIEETRVSFDQRRVCTLTPLLFHLNSPHSY
jgi:hypothetical protein